MARFSFEILMVMETWKGERKERCERRPRREVCIAASVRGAESAAAHIGAQHTLRCGGLAGGGNVGKRSPSVSRSMWVRHL